MFLKATTIRRLKEQVRTPNVRVLPGSGLRSRVAADGAVELWIDNTVTEEAHFLSPVGSDVAPNGESSSGGGGGP